MKAFRHFVASMPAPVASGWSDFAGWGLHPPESAAFSRRTWKRVFLDVSDQVFELAEVTDDDEPFAQF